jgi:hypothetical protein
MSNNSRWDDLASENERLVAPADPRRGGPASSPAGSLTSCASASAVGQARHRAERSAPAGTSAVRSLAARTRRWRTTRNPSGR